MMKEKQLDLQFDSPLGIGHFLLDIGYSFPSFPSFPSPLYENQRHSPH